MPSQVPGSAATSGLPQRKGVQHPLPLPDEAEWIAKVAYAYFHMTRPPMAVLRLRKLVRAKRYTGKLPNGF